MNARRIFVRDLTSANISKFFSKKVYIPNPNLLGSPRVKYYVDDVKHAYTLARVLLENNNPILYIE